MQTTPNQARVSFYREKEQATLLGRQKARAAFKKRGARLMAYYTAWDRVHAEHTKPGWAVSCAPEEVILLGAEWDGFRCEWLALQKAKGITSRDIANSVLRQAMERTV